jgi:hypothetical protein
MASRGSSTEDLAMRDIGEVSFSEHDVQVHSIKGTPNNDGVIEYIVGWRLHLITIGYGHH